MSCPCLYDLRTFWYITFHIQSNGGATELPGFGVGILIFPVIFPGARVGIWFGEPVGGGHCGTKQQGSFGSDTIWQSADFTWNVGHL
jgi:hypothetical protein